MTHAERARRRGEVKAALRSGERVRSIAERLGLSVDYVREIGFAAGLSHPVGRPRRIACEETRRRYVNLRSRIGAAAAWARLENEIIG